MTEPNVIDTGIVFFYPKEGNVATLAERMNIHDLWKNGNGGKGAEARLQEIEAFTERVKTGEACTAKDILKEIKDDIKKLNKWFYLMTLFMCVLAGDRIFNLLSLIK